MHAKVIALSFHEQSRIRLSIEAAFVVSACERAERTAAGQQEPRRTGWKRSRMSRFLQDMNTGNDYTVTQVQANKHTNKLSHALAVG